MVAPTKTQPGTQLSLFPDEVPVGNFIGTDNPRHFRVLDAMRLGPIMREELDHVGGCSNGPALVTELRNLGLAVKCKRLGMRDRDGRHCRPGRYEFTENDYQLVTKWFNRRDKSKPVLPPR